jgi:hypothetical protein
MGHNQPTQSTGQTNYNTLPTGNCFYQFERIFLSLAHVKMRLECNYSFGLSFSQIQLAFLPQSKENVCRFIHAIDASVALSHSHTSRAYGLRYFLFHVMKATCEQ